MRAWRISAWFLFAACDAASPAVSDLAGAEAEADMAQPVGASCTPGAPGSMAAACAALHRECVLSGGVARCGGCRADAAGCFVGPATPEEGACRAPTTCAECGANRVCTPAVGCGDATCGSCSTGFVDAAGACVTAQTPESCAAAHREFIAVTVAGYCGACLSGYDELAGHCAIPSCSGGADSLGALCAALNRGCVAGPPAACDACSANSTLDVASQACVPSSLCERRTDCPEAGGFYCLQLQPGDEPRCRKRPCPSGQSWDRVGQMCESCACGGKEWPVGDGAGGCVCEPPPGSFYNRTRLQVMSCDQDRDGWLHKEVQDELRQATQPMPYDYTVLLNVRCTIPVFSEILLRNEWRQTKSLTPPTPTVAMYEHPDNDTGANPQLGSLSAASINSLTKACATLSLDLNRNGVADLFEHHASASSSEPWSAPYRAFTAFVELHKLRYVKTAPDPTEVVPCAGCPPVKLPATLGRIEIEERSRCDEIPFALSGSSDYWRNCTRRRDGGFATATAQPLAYDFAAFDCNGSMSCPSPPPLGMGQPGTVPPHGLCDGGVATEWRGMTHYSQFRCAVLLDNPDPSKRNEVLRGPASSWEPQSCTLAGEDDATPSPGKIPRFTCVPNTSAPAGTVTWVARLFKPYKLLAEYQGGCVDEGAEWGYLCAVDRPLAAGSEFGQLRCSPSCIRHLDPSVGVNHYFAKDDWWLCGHPTGSVFVDGRTAFVGPSPSPTPGPDTWKLFGEISLGFGDGIELKSADCNSGGANCYRIK